MAFEFRLEAMGDGRGIDRLVSRRLIGPSVP